MNNVLKVDVTFVGKQANDIIMKPIFFDDDIMQRVRVEPGIKWKQQLALDSRYEKILKKGKNCVRSAQQDMITVSEKDLVVCELEADLSQCAKNLTQEFIADWLKDGSLDENDLTGTRIESYISEKVQQALALDVQRIVWLGDENSADEDYNQCDGFWVRIFDGVASYEIDRILNLGSGEPSGTDARDWLRAIVKGADPALKGIANTDKCIWVTETVGDALEDFYEDTENRGGFTKLTMDGQTKLMYRGIEVVVLRNIDRFIDADLGGVFPNRIVYAAKDNLVVGTDLVSDFSKMEFWYDRQDKVNRIDVAMKLGTQILFGDLIAVAY